MTPETRQALTRAQALLPRQPQLPQCPPRSNAPCPGIVICILVWLKVCSGHWHARQAEPTLAFAEGGPLLMAADCTFAALCEAKGASTVDIIQQAIDELVILNPSLKGVLQPLHFTHLQERYTEAKAHPDALQDWQAYRTAVGAFYTHAMANAAQFNPIH